MNGVQIMDFSLFLFFDMNKLYSSNEYVVKDSWPNAIEF